MSKIGKSDGVQTRAIAPTGGVTHDVPFFAALGWLIPLRDAEAGARVDCYARGSYSLPVASGQTFAANASVWYDAVEGHCVATDNDTESIGAYAGADDQDATRIVVSLFGPTRPLAAEAMALVESPTSDHLCAMDADGQATDSGIAAGDVATMAAVGGVGELLYTAAADRSAAKSGITKAAIEGLIAAVVMPAGPLSDGGTDAIAVAIDVKNLLGDNVAAPKFCHLWASTTALGAFVEQISSLAVVCGQGLWERFPLDGEGLYRTDPEGNLDVVASYTGGALTAFLNVECGGHLGSVELQFA